MAKIARGPHKTKADLESAVDAKYHDLFVEVPDVGFVLDTDEAEGLRSEKDKAIAGKRAAEEKARAAENAAEEAQRKADEAAAELKKLKEDEESRQAGSTPEEVEELVQARIGQMQKDLETRLEAALGERDEWQAKYEALDVKHSSTEVDRALRKAAAKLALPFSSARAQDTLMKEGLDVFSLNDDGEIEGRDANGNLMMSKDAKNPMQPEEWLVSQHASQEQSYLFTGKSGGGAEDPPSRRRSSGGGEETSRSKIAAGIERLRASA